MRIAQDSANGILWNTHVHLQLSQPLLRPASDVQVLDRGESLPQGCFAIEFVVAGIGNVGLISRYFWRTFLLKQCIMGYSRMPGNQLHRSGIDMHLTTRCLSSATFAAGPPTSQWLSWPQSTFSRIKTKITDNKIRGTSFPVPGLCPNDAQQSSDVSFVLCCVHRIAIVLTTS